MRRDPMQGTQIGSIVRNWFRRSELQKPAVEAELANSNESAGEEQAALEQELKGRLADRDGT